MGKPSNEVTAFLDSKNHPLRKEIELLRKVILAACGELTENIKWNGPNYAVGDQDRITMKIHPPRQLQLIFHRGAKVKEQPTGKLLKEDYGLLDWKANDRAVATFKNQQEIEAGEKKLHLIVADWMAKTID
jgi:hypothetical protein